MHRSYRVNDITILSNGILIDEETASILKDNDVKM